MTKKYQLYIITTLFITFIACDGTLGGFKTIRFSTSKSQLERAISELYSQHPEFKIPVEYEQFNNWSKMGYDFLDSRIFYLSDEPEEMYYVSFIGDEATFKDTTNIDIAIRSVFVVNKKRWVEVEGFNESEIGRIQRRFKLEIISKLEKYSNSESKELSW